MGVEDRVGLELSERERRPARSTTTTWWFPLGWVDGGDSSLQDMEALEKMQADSSLSFPAETTIQREGLYESDSYYLVYEAADVRQLIAKLARAGEVVGFEGNDNFDQLAHWRYRRGLLQREMASTLEEVNPSNHEVALFCYHLRYLIEEAALHGRSGARWRPRSSDRLTLAKQWAPTSRLGETNISQLAASIASAHALIDIAENMRKIVEAVEESEEKATRRLAELGRLMQAPNGVPLEQPESKIGDTHDRSPI